MGVVQESRSLLQVTTLVIARILLLSEERWNCRNITTAQREALHWQIGIDIW